MASTKLRWELSADDRELEALKVFAERLREDIIVRYTPAVRHVLSSLCGTVVRGSRAIRAHVPLDATVSMARFEWGAVEQTRC